MSDEEIVVKALEIIKIILERKYDEDIRKQKWTSFRDVATDNDTYLGQFWDNIDEIIQQVKECWNENRKRN